MANKTTTIIFKAEDQISPALKNATQSVAGLSQSFSGISDAANKSASQIRAELIKSLKEAETQLKALSGQKVTPEVLLKKGQILGQIDAIKGQLRDVDKLVAKPKIALPNSLELNAIAQSFSAIGGALSELKNSAVASFKEFDAARTRLTTIGDAGKALAGDLRGLSKELGFQATAADLATGGYDVLSGGFNKTGDAAKVLKAATVGAVGGFSDATKVSKALVATLASYGATADDAASFVDKFSSVQQNGLITIDEYADRIAQVAPIAAQAGVKLDELNGFIATATSFGVPARQTFSGLRAAISSTLKPSSEAVDLAEKLGVSFGAQALKTKGLSGILGELNAKGLDTAENLSILFGSVEAVAALAPSAGKGFKILTANIDASANSAGTATKNFDIVANSIGGQAKALQNELNESLSQFGEKILAVTNPVIAGTAAIVRAFNALPGPMQAIIAVIVGGGAAVAGLGAAIATIGAIVTPTLAGLNLLASGVVGLTAKMGLTAVASTTAAAGVATTGTAAATASVGVGALSASLGVLALAAGALATTLNVGGLIADRFGVGEATQSLDKLSQQLDELDAKRGTIKAPSVDPASSKGSDLGNDGFIFDPFQGGVLKRQKDVIDFADKQATLNKVFEEGNKTLQQYGLTTASVASKQKLGAEGTKKFSDDAKNQVERLDLTIKALSDIAKKQPANAGAVNADIAALSSQKRVFEQRIKFLNEQEKAAVSTNGAIIRSEKQVEESVAKRIANEKNAQDSLAKNRQRDFANEAKTDSRAFDSQAQTDKRAFEKTINEEKRVFEAGQKTEKAAFEKGLQKEQRDFAQTEKQSDQTYQKSKQDAERVFSQAQQAQKAAFDKSQQDASRAFDAKQNTDKKTADDQFALKKIAIERQLQLDAAKTPEDRTKLEAEFKASDEKAAKEKLAFADLLAEQDAFTKKQQADKVIFDEAQKAAQKVIDLEQQTAKLAFDDAIKLKDQAYELQKNEAKLAFEDTLKVKKDALEATQSAAKLVAEDAIAVKKQAFDDAEKVKKDAFEDSLNVKKAAFEDSERVKKQDFEASLKQLEKQFNADERAKDVASAQQVASIKGAASLSAAPKVALAGLGIGVSPRAKGGRFDQGQQLLVGEQGAEIVTFGSSGFVSTAADSKQILSSNQAPNVVNTAKLEQLMGAMVAQMGGVAGKLDRPNVAITSEKDPNRVLAEVYRSAAVTALDRGAL